MMRGLLSLLLICLTGCVLPASRAHEERLDDQEQTWLEVRDDVDYVKYEQGNVVSELRMFDSKMATQESLIEGARRELAEAQVKNSEQMSRSLTDFQSRLATMESDYEAIVQDLRDLKSHAGGVASSLGQAKQRMGGLEKSIDAQMETIRSLEGAVRALMALVETSDNVPSSAFAKGASRGYRVNPGDTLEKIATREGSTIRAIKEANGLKSDLIRVGQTLRIPK